VPIDLILYALIAAGLVFWLRSVLGTRHGEERERPNPYIKIEILTAEEAAALGDGPESLSAPERIERLAQNPGPVNSIADKTAENGLLEIAAIDKNFDIDFFLQGAQDAFAIIVEAYAAGDRETLKGLLSPGVYTAFDGGIAAREERKETQVTDIHAIRKAEIVAAKREDRMAFVTLRIVADESSITRDAQGAVIFGSLEKITQTKDIWTFGRDLKSKDPTWLVYETRTDIGDNYESTPTTH
jgi:predicted lipid-binding transport protein (Tim44 family)